MEKDSRPGPLEYVQISKKTLKRLERIGRKVAMTRDECISRAIDHFIERHSPKPRRRKSL